MDLELPIQPTEPLSSQLAGGSSDLAGSMLQESLRRFRTITLVYAFSFVCAWKGIRVLAHALSSSHKHAEFTDHIISEILGWTAIGGALALGLSLGRLKLTGRSLGWLGAAFQILGGAGIASVIFSDDFPENAVPMGITWVTFWIAIFPGAVPMRDKQLLVSCFGTALASFGVLKLCGVVGFNPPPDWVVTVMVTADLIAAFGGFFMGRMVYRLGKEAGRARRMGSYILERMLGRGGMGEVWLARHHLLARPAAIKLIRPERLHGGTGAVDASQMMVMRFEREARATAQLRSPHTIELYDFGIAPDGAFYYVMELLDGLDLGGLVDRFGPVPPSRAVYLLKQVAHSLAEAHEAGLIHRDIKPSNIFTAWYGRDPDFVKVLDFGLVKREAQADQTGLTQEGAVPGTPAYMAPEVALGERSADVRSDLYALGCVAYWLLAGRRVFEGQTPMRVAVQHIHEAPIPVDEVAEQSIPEGLTRLVMQCLEKSPDDRPQSAEALIEALDELDQPEQAWSRARANRWWQTHLPDVIAGTRRGWKNHSEP